MDLTFFADADGTTTVEYGLIAALVAVVMILVLTNIGQSLESNTTTVSSALDGAI